MPIYRTPWLRRHKTNADGDWYGTRSHIDYDWVCAKSIDDYWEVPPKALLRLVVSTEPVEGAVRGRLNVGVSEALNRFWLKHELVVEAWSFMHPLIPYVWWWVEYKDNGKGSE